MSKLALHFELLQKKLQKLPMFKTNTLTIILPVIIIVIYYYLCVVFPCAKETVGKMEKRVKFLT